MKSVEISVQGMDCQSCAQTIENHLLRQEGIEKAEVDYIKDLITVTFDRAHLKRSDIERQIEEIGYTPATDSQNKNSFIRKDIIPIILSGIFLFCGWYALFQGTERYIYLTWFSLSILSGGYLTFLKGYRALREFSLDMNFLMTIATIGAILIGEWQEAAVIIFLFSVANFLESASLEKARRSIEATLDLSPEQATVKTASGNIEKPVEDIKVGDRVVVKPGDRIPVDGRVVNGSSRVDESTITGESTPVFKEEDSEVFSGTICQNGTLEIEAQKTAENSTLAEIMHLVEEARSTKAPVEYLIDRFASLYTPTVIVISAIIAFVPPFFGYGNFSSWIYKGLVILVISCPCALIISTPVTIVSALSKAARHGFIIKGGKYLEAIGKIKLLAMDKTGTLTRGEPNVSEIKSLNATTEEELLRIAASIETHSDHPVARAIVSHAKERNTEFKPGRKFKSYQGRGAQAVVRENKYIIGNHRLFQDKELCSDELHYELDRFENRTKTPVFIGDRDGVIGIIVISDRIKANAGRSIEMLKNLGVEISMLTGDAEGPAQKVSRKLGIGDHRSGLLPSEKTSAVESLIEQYGDIAMIGDGVNDAPSLAVAPIGIAMGVRGTDAAKETADITLIKDDLSKLPELVKLSRSSLKIVKQNVGFAFLVKLVFIILALTGHATLWMAVAADVGASLLVIFNGMRALGK